MMQIYCVVRSETIQRNVHIWKPLANMLLRFSRPFWWTVSQMNAIRWERRQKPTLELSRKAIEMHEIINCCFYKSLSFKLVCYAPIDNGKSNCLPYVCICTAQKYIKLYFTIKCTSSPCRFPLLALNLYEVPLLKDSPLTAYNMTLLHTHTALITFLIAAPKYLTKAT